MSILKRFWNWFAGIPDSSYPKVTTVAASVTPKGVFIFTFIWVYHRFIHGEVMTHRDFSRNAMSSRAMPTYKLLKQVWFEPATPLHWGKLQPGMQAKQVLSPFMELVCRILWKNTGRLVCAAVWILYKLGLHKQVANRLIEPWQLMTTVVTATEWENFFELRCHPDAQPEFQYLAKAVRAEYEIGKLTARKLTVNSGTHTDWHLPFVSEDERKTLTLKLAVRCSAARCARTSFLNHDGTTPNVLKDEDLFLKLVGSVPMHASPIEHQAQAAEVAHIRSGNFRGYYQFRQIYKPPSKGR